MHPQPDSLAQTDITELRRDMAALFRWTAREGLHEGIANHYSCAVSPDGQQFLMNPYGVHFSAMRASDLILLDTDNPPDPADSKIDITAWGIHGAMHRANPHARILLHLHPHYATALMCLAEPDLPPLDQNCARFYNRVAWDSGFDGMGIGAEGERLSTLLGNKRVLMMGNHGVMTAAQTPGLAFDLIYYLERACRTYMTALASGRKLAVMDAKTAEKTARQWEDYALESHHHMAAIRAVLDKEESDYAD